MSICVVDISNERCMNGEHIQDVDCAFPLEVEVKISRVALLLIPSSHNYDTVNENKHLN